jgi:hypothetical protein
MQRHILVMQHNILGDDHTWHCMAVSEQEKHQQIETWKFIHIYAIVQQNIICGIIVRFHTMTATLNVA